MQTDFPAMKDMISLDNVGKQFDGTGALVTAALTYLIIYVLQVPFTGSYQLFVEVVAGLLLASLAIGFAISLISSSERQAVQLSMLVLIASVFFSGFFMRLESFA